MHVESVKYISEIQLQVGPSWGSYAWRRAEASAVDESTEHELEKSKVNKAKYLRNIQLGICRIR